MHYAYPAEQVVRRKAQNALDDDAHLFAHELVKHLPAVQADLPQKTLIAPSGQLLHGCALATHQLRPNAGIMAYVRAYGKCLLSLLPVRRMRQIDQGFFITNSSSSNFFHWFLDVLQKLEFASQTKGFESQEQVFILPPGHQAAFILDSLQAFGFSFIHQQSNEILWVERLTVLPEIAPTGNYRREVVRSLRERLRAHFSTPDAAEKATRSRVYITRRNARIRKILNEDQLLPILENAGFEVLDMDSLSFKGQIEAMRHVDLLISLHGAGLTHMLWMKKPGCVFEIRARGDGHNNCYFSLASDLGLDYYYALADKSQPNLNTQQADYVIDPEHFKTVLQRMLAASGR